MKLTNLPLPILLQFQLLLTSRNVASFSLSMKASSSSSSSSSSRPQNYVVIGGGIQGTSVAYHLSTSSSLPPSSTITILEAKSPASAASGKGGGFMARSWGDGSPTQTLHHLSFDMYPVLAEKLGCETYRTIPVLSVAPGSNGRGLKAARSDGVTGPLVPSWLDGDTGRVRPMGMGDDTAQITPVEFVEKMLENSDVNVVLGECVGVNTVENAAKDGKKVTGVKYRPLGKDQEEVLLADAVVVSAGPWSCAAEDWFGTCQLPMEGVKSTSIVWKEPNEGGVDATALFCGEDDRFGTHLEVYPRPDNTVYICGIGGSDYISTDELKAGAFRDECNAKETRVQAATDAFTTMSSTYKKDGELQKVQACMRPCPPDAMPYMGPIPNVEGAFINAGHNCWGIAWAPGAGKAMAELVLEGSCKCMDLSPFDPERFTPVNRRGGRGRKRQGESVGEQW